MKPLKGLVSCYLLLQGCYSSAASGPGCCQRWDSGLDRLCVSAAQALFHSYAAAKQCCILAKWVAQSFFFNHTRFSTFAKFYPFCPLPNKYKDDKILQSQKKDVIWKCPKNSTFCRCQMMSWVFPKADKVVGECTMVWCLQRVHLHGVVDLSQPSGLSYALPEPCCWLS